MKVVHATQSDSRGGAARAAFRVHRALRGEGVNSWMVVDRSDSDDGRVLRPSSASDALRSRVAGRLNSQVAGLQASPNPTVHSPAVFSGSAMRRITRESPDVVNLHWVGAGFLTVRQIGRFDCPVVWRLADMWAYCGAEHYDGLLGEARWREGYSRTNRPRDHFGLDVDRWTWWRKRRAWQRRYHIVAPSRWTADRVAASALLSEWPVRVIPNPLPLEVFRPYPVGEARQQLGLPTDTPLVLFGADGGARNLSKGFDLLEAAMARVASKAPSVEAVVFGEGRASSQRHPYPVHWMGRIDDDRRLAMLYSASDVMVVPSRQEAFGQVGSEAQACGTPVVAFRNTGLEDVVSHKRTGHLARHLDVEDLARGIQWVLEEASRERLAAEARRRAVRLWSPGTIAAQYVTAYEDAIEQQQ